MSVDPPGAKFSSTVRSSNLTPPPRKALEPAGRHIKEVAADASKSRSEKPVSPSGSVFAEAANLSSKKLPPGQKSDEDGPVKTVSSDNAAKVRFTVPEGKNADRWVVGSAVPRAKGPALPNIQRESDTSTDAKSVLLVGPDLVGKNGGGETGQLDESSTDSDDSSVSDDWQFAEPRKRDNIFQRLFSRNQ